MPPVDAAEHADGDHTATPVGGDVFQASNATRAQAYDRPPTATTADTRTPVTVR